ncbi:MAG: type II toxin-antitoxin system ParD family antitoxin [Geobacter sp.]|nr:type II toxin-antitoxin system ParD family antitoxin [Geobacter sp.]
MPRNASVTLGAHFDRFVDAQVHSGLFCSRSEVIRAGLTLLEDNQAKLSALKQAITTGLESGSVECSYEEFMNDLYRDRQ